LIPITSVTAAQAKELSPEEKIRQYSKQYLDSTYEGTINLLSTDYFTDSKRFAQLTIYTEQKIENKTLFRNNLLSHIQEQEDLVDIISLQRQENWTEPEKVKEQKDLDLDSIQESFNTNFSKRTSINNLDILYLSPEDENKRDTLLIALNLTTTIGPESLEKKLETRKNDLQQSFTREVTLEVVVEFLESLTF
jgi:spore coat protein CotF